MLYADCHIYNFMLLNQNILYFVKETSLSKLKATPPIRKHDLEFIYICVFLTQQTTFWCSD